MHMSEEAAVLGVRRSPCGGLQITTNGLKPYTESFYLLHKLGKKTMRPIIVCLYIFRVYKLRFLTCVERRCAVCCIVSF